MARVGKKKFPYTKTGMKAARKYAKKTGKKMTSAKSKKIVSIFKTWRYCKNYCDRSLG